MLILMRFIIIWSHFGLVLGCVDLIFRCLDLYSGYCIPVGCDYGVHAPTRRGLCACRRRFFFFKKHAPGFLEHVFCGCCDFWAISRSPGKKNSKYGSSVQMTMPVRRASKFSTKRRAVLLQIIFPSLISQAIPGFCEPWSECQPEESRPPEGRPEDSSIYI